MNKRHHIIALLLFFLFSHLYAGEGIDPASACDFMRDQGFKGRMNYRENRNDLYSCASLRKRVNRGEPTGSNIRYLVTGSATEAREISLRLRMISHRAPQQVLAEFNTHASKLYEKALGQQLPDNISSAIRSALQDEWQFEGYRVKLERLHDKAVTYDLLFSIEIQ